MFRVNQEVKKLSYICDNQAKTQPISEG